MIVVYEPKYREEIERMGRAMHAESVFRDLPLDIDKAVRIADFFVLSVEDGRANGMFMAVLTEHWFCDAKVAYDLLHYVEPAARGGMAGVKLLHAYETWGRLAGAYEINIGQHTGVEIERTAMLYQAKGFDIVGKNARKIVGVTSCAAAS